MGLRDPAKVYSPRYELTHLSLDLLVSLLTLGVFKLIAYTGLVDI